MTKRKWIGGLAAALTALACGAPSAAQELLYKLERSATLPSTDTGWDYVKLEPGGSRLFMARQKDALTVFDVAQNKAIGTVANSVGANGPLLIPEVDRGYVAMTDGSMLSFKLSTLEPIARTPLSTTGGLNSGIYDPATKRVHMIESSRPAESTFFTFDAATGKALGKTVFPFRKIDDPAYDGKGTLFVPARRDNLILKVNSKTLAEEARWAVECNVSKVYYQAATNRLLAACLGDAPVFLAIDAATGKTVATVPIGKGIDGFIVDEARGRIVTSNGIDGTLTVIKQSGPDDYALAGTVSTRPGGRMMHFDAKTGKLFVVAADYTQTPPDSAGAIKRVYHPDSFVVLTYGPL